jgi:hypothetical protein
VLFAIGHTLGFRKVDPRWGADSVTTAMQSVRFDVQGFSRGYWDFYVGFGLFVTVFILFAAVLAWQLGSMSSLTSRGLPVIAWSFVVCFAGVTILSWRYFFIAPIVFCSAITLCLALGAWLGTRPSRA